MKTYVLTLSKTFMKGHPKEGCYTNFKEQFIAGLYKNKLITIEYIVELAEKEILPENYKFIETAKETLSTINGKIHTLRVGKFWEKVVDEVNDGLAVLSVREWTGLPYRSKQVEIACLKKIGYQPIKLYDFDRIKDVNDKSAREFLEVLAKNDGLLLDDFVSWFNANEEGNLVCGIIQFTDFEY